MSCASETYASSAGPHTSGEREIHHASPFAPDGSRMTAARVVSDTTKADPEHIWGDEAPVNE
jgi:hypothetical protein